MVREDTEKGYRDRQRRCWKVHGVIMIVIVCAPPQSCQQQFQHTVRVNQQPYTYRCARASYCLSPPFLLCAVIFTTERERIEDTTNYSFPNGPSPLGRHGHGTIWPGTKTAWPGSYHARAWAVMPAQWHGTGTARFNGRHEGGTASSCWMEPPAC